MPKLPTKNPPVSTPPQSWPRWSQTINPLLWLVLATLYLIHGLYIYEYSVDMPHMDSWELIRQPQIFENFEFKWLLLPHNEHRIFFTRVVTILAYKLQAWDVGQVILFNYLFYGCLILSLGYIIKKFIPTIPSLYFMVGLAGLLTTSPRENHLWDFQNQFHAFLFFSLWAGYFILRPVTDSRLTTAGFIALGISSAWIAVFSFSAGLFFIFPIGILLVYRQFASQSSFKSTSHLIVVLFILATPILWFIISYQSVVHDVLPGEKLYPWQSKFWYFCMNMVSGGFGFKVRTAVPALIAVVFCIVACLGCWHQRKTWQSGHQLILCIVSGILMFCMAVTYGRGSAGLWASKSSRYLEVTAFLIPCCFAGIWLAPWSKRTRHRICNGLLLFVILGIHNDWNFHKAYYEEYKNRVAAKKCVTAYYQGPHSGICKQTYPKKISELLDNAARLNLSFYRNLDH